MKVVINACYGGFGLSRKATKRLCELQGRACYFFVNPREPKLDLHTYAPADPKATERELFIWYAFDIENPNSLRETKPWQEMTMDERKAHNDLWGRHSIDHGRELTRHDPLLVRVVEELGEDASGAHAKLEIVEIPDGVEYEIEEYDGIEHIAEKHRKWS